MRLRPLSLLIVTLLLSMGAIVSAPITAGAPAEDAFWRTWARTDKPVANGTVSRTWMWGPQSLAIQRVEPYHEAPDARRVVRYFDKARMELTHPDAYDDGLWYVSNGLLVVELVTGRMQIGDAEFEGRSPAQINVAGDPSDPAGPTYATFGALLTSPPLVDGAIITQRLDRAGTVTDDDALGAHNVTAAYRVSVPGIDHQVASPFWAFMQARGPVYEQGEVNDALLFVSPFYATGYPITEAYWASVTVAGEVSDVLLQCFERRCLTYTPSNPEGWQVEAGNVGRHYYEWRYGPATGPGRIAYAGYDIRQEISVVNADGSGLTRLASVSGLEPTSVAWSPDRTRLAFAAHHDGDRDVFVMHADGTGTINLTDHPASDGAPAWSPDGTRIVFTSDRESGTRDDTDLFIVNADGSDVTKLFGTSAQEMSPRWSPEGARIAFISTEIDDSTISDLYVINTDGSDLVRLTSSPGYPSSSSESGLDWSPDGTRIAFAAESLSGSGADSDSDVYVVHADGSDLTNVTRSPAYELEPTWSPDGAHIAFISSNGGGSDIYLMEPDGAGRRDLTNHPARYDRPSWSLDGSSILISSDRDAAARDSESELYVINLDEPDVTRLTNNTRHDVAVAWSADGSSILFVSIGAGSEIFIADADGSRVVQLTSDTADDTSPVWSPDGTRLAFESRDLFGNASEEIYVVNADGSGLINVSQTPDASDHAPRWSPDGTRLVFGATVQKAAPYGESVDEEVLVVNADGTGKINLSQHPADDYEPSWSPDGTRILFTSQRDGNDELYVVNANGTGLTNLTNRVENEYASAWSPDGSRIVFVSNALSSNDVEVYIMGADGSGVTNLTNHAAHDDAPVWSPDGAQILFTSDRDQEAGSLDYYVMDADGTGLLRLTSAAGRTNHATWSPDSSRILFVVAGDWTKDHCCPSWIYVVSADGTGLVSLTPESTDFVRPRWSPDGTRVAYVTAGAINVMHANGSGVIDLTNMHGYVPVWDTLVWSPVS